MTKENKGETQVPAETKATAQQPAEKPQAKTEQPKETKASVSKIEVKQIAWFDDRFYKIRYENDKKVEVEDYIPSITTKLNALPIQRYRHCPQAV